MKTYKLENDADFKLAAQECAAQLEQAGSVLLLPTETVYGLACRSNDEIARERIYELKAREKNKPLQIFFPDIDSIYKNGINLEGPALKLAKAFCPGPLTIVAPDSTGGTIGFRMPDHPLIHEILKIFKSPLAATSANRSGQAPALSMRAALEDICGKPDIAIDGGDLHPKAQASTVVEVSDGNFKILRPGPITEEMIKAALFNQ
jgi:L-threonylcarbamoyladenylate synthase